jgi:DAK2 domain fusion protein YloV
VAVLEELDTEALRRWGDIGLAALGQARAEIDALNVFPVPDGDTGTNLFLTFEAGVSAAATLSTQDPATLTNSFARGALLGARGNSGVILSQLLRGMAESFGGLSGPVGGRELGAALTRAADLGYAAVARPVEGTVLTVARAAAQAAGSNGTALAGTVARAAEAARVALARTPDQLAALKVAGVVDAGGRGLVVLLEALETVVTGVAPAVSAWERPLAAPDRPVHGADPDGPAFEVMYLIDAPDEATAGLRDALDRLGDSVVVVGGEGLWNVHVHADDPGKAVEAGVAVGRPFRIRITALAEIANGVSPGAARGVVAVVPGRGLADLFESVGATAIDGGPGRRPSPAVLLDAISACGTREVVVLPNDSDHVAAAETAAEHARANGLRVAVVPTRAPVQGLAALAVHDHERRFDDDVVAMTSAAGATRHGGVTLAVREAMTSVGICQAGDVLGLIDGDIAVIGREIQAVAFEVVDRMLAGGGELVTLVRGDGTAGELASAVKRHIHDVRPDVEVVSYDGEQTHYPLLVGVE